MGSEAPVAAWLGAVVLWLRRRPLVPACTSVLAPAAAWRQKACCAWFSAAEVFFCPLRKPTMPHAKAQAQAIHARLAGLRFAAALCSGLQRSLGCVRAGIRVRCRVARRRQLAVRRSTPQCAFISGPRSHPAGPPGRICRSSGPTGGAPAAQRGRAAAQARSDAARTGRGDAQAKATAGSSTRA